MGTGRITEANIELEVGSVRDEHFSSTAAHNLDADKVQQHVVKGTNFGLVITGTPVDDERIVYIAQGSETLRGFHACLNVTGTTSNIDFDVKINGTTALSAVVNFTNADADGAVKDGTLSTTSLSADDIVSIECNQTTNTGSQGPYAWVNIEGPTPVS